MALADFQYLPIQWSTRLNTDILERRDIFFRHDGFAKGLKIVRGEIRNTFIF